MTSLGLSGLSTNGPSVSPQLTVQKTLPILESWLILFQTVHSYEFCRIPWFDLRWPQLNLIDLLELRRSFDGRRFFMLFCTYDGHIPEVINYCVISLILFRYFRDVFRWQNMVTKWVTKFLSLKFRVWTAYYEFIYSRIADNLCRPWTVYPCQGSVFIVDGPWSLRKHWFISNLIPKLQSFLECIWRTSEEWAQKWLRNIHEILIKYLV